MSDHGGDDLAGENLADSPGGLVSQGLGIESRIPALALFHQPLEASSGQGGGELDIS